MSTLDKVYEPTALEARWYPRWLEAKAFASSPDSQKEPFVVMIPPPNVTGVLHMGHVLNNVLQDIFTRRARLEGKEALWFPGMDHAGIATQSVVERELRKEGTNRYELGREKFLERVWEWREKHGGIILQQLQRLGASCDWDRTSFTLDPRYARAVLQAFVTLQQRGYIYRGARMINWCPVSRTALSDEEVIMKPQQGFLYRMRYELVEKPGTFVEIATTRPETIPGDTAVAVHPDDERYRELIGLHVWRPFPRAEIPIIGDSAVDREFGTGVLKVTPAHDPLDFEIGQRHDLPVRDVFHEDATLNELAGEGLAGLDREKGRKVAAQMLEEGGNLVKAEPYENTVGFSERADVPIEPRLSEQWWLTYPKVAEALQAVDEEIVSFHPQRWAKVYRHWLETMQRDQIDWCISRQLWWGHRIPVWYNKGIARKDLDFSNPEHVHVSVDGPDDPENWEQEEDVLDTWASSWLWCLANFNWPDTEGEQGEEFRYYYPTSVLVTGFDIIFLWVARMIIAGLEFVGEEKEKLTAAEIAERIPFRDVYITGLVRDAQGRKMSKSLGNSPDVFKLLERFGADGVRFGIVNIAPRGQDILFSEDRLEIGRNFGTKIWNACRFRQMSGTMEANHSLPVILGRIDPDYLDLYDRWILGRTLETMAEVERCFASYEMPQMAQALYAFFWGDFCDWYVEAAKVFAGEEGPVRDNNLAVQDLVIRQSLLLLEPLMPFLCEELWQQLGYAGEDQQFIQDARLETAAAFRKALTDRGIEVDPTALAQVNALNALISAGRSLKAQYRVANRRDVAFLFAPNDRAAQDLVLKQMDIVKRLLGADAVALTEKPPERCPASVQDLGTLYLDLAKAIDIEAEKERLAKEQAKLDKVIAGTEARLNNAKFVDNAPAEVVAGARAQLADNRAKRDEIARLLKELG